MQIFDKIRKHAKLTLTVIGAFCIILAIVSGKQSSKNKAALLNSVSLQLPDLNLPALPPPLPEQIKDKYKKVTVKNGDTLSKIFSNVGIPSAELQAILSNNSTSKQLTSIRPGQTLNFLFDNNQALKEIVVPVNKQKTLSIKKTSDNYQFDLQEKPIEQRLSFSSNNIQSSLYKSAISAGLDDQLINQMSEIFGWDIDFSLDIRPGDNFRILYEEQYVENEKLDNGKIIAAEFTNKGKTYHAVHYKDANGKIHYYNPKGYGLQKAFLRSPVKFTRISSHFSLGRKHPILHIIRAHTGTDYAAPRNTPVRAAGDGKVIFAGKKNGYGNVVILQHGSKYSTLYGHLEKFASNVRSGSNVSQGQVIGYVGDTGLATAPHLHYEFRINGVHQNPLTVQLPQTLEIPQTERSKFLNHASEMLKLLDQHSQKRT